MKLMLVGLLVTVSLYSNNDFQKDVEYTCVNTYFIKKDIKYIIDQENTQQQVLKVSVVEDKLHANDEEVFDFLIHKGHTTSFSHGGVMLLMTKELELGLVPRKERGQLQYYFKCTKV